MEAALWLVSDRKSLDAVTGQHVITVFAGRMEMVFRLVWERKVTGRLQRYGDEIRREQLMLVYACPAATAPSRQSGLFPLAHASSEHPRPPCPAPAPTLCCMPPGLPGLQCSRCPISPSGLRCRAADAEDVLSFKHEMPPTHLFTQT